MIREERSKLHRNSNENPPMDEIDRLSRMAGYYERLGCVDVARSLRQMIAARQVTSEPPRNEA